MPACYHVLHARVVYTCQHACQCAKSMSDGMPTCQITCQFFNFVCQCAKRHTKFSNIALTKCYWEFSYFIIRPLFVESLVIVIVYVIFLMQYAVIIIILEKICFLVKRKQGVNNCFTPLIPSAFTTVASRLKSEQKEMEKLILKPNTVRFKLINP